ncbi:aldehyde dehydrogenase (NADP(+)) [Mycobacterium sp. ITM-2016-00318]|uniref:aldehyde dehydrogenase (NADP(+)) n=1 Tax=Mycobacterium sp. ITM-2016-00318 TaxID=2099693 RepID=UPI000CF85156|nr:aldehyde dehydrogenase (NADP(+)) [Mycobacterium sp. ITM-2016-00318]WNG93580.1 aldehyde dehydrogenase (NADP(+)) [Mycobacterium sp. ITM-2016-00318]
MTATMPDTALTGRLLIAGEQVRGSGKSIRAFDPTAGRELEPAYFYGDSSDVDAACAAAAAAFADYRTTSAEQRAQFLETIAVNIEAVKDAIVARAAAESGLPQARLTGEVGRTTGQLRLFAGVLREGSWNEARIDPALPDRTPLRRPDIRQRSVPLGPVAVFGASNFPLAFSVAGGDTASALAAGCPVVVKAHDAHPGTSEIVGRAITDAVAAAGLPAGTFSLLYGFGPDLGVALVTDPRIKAVGFTGSRSGGMALVAAAAGRPEPIPVYAEMSSINPVFLLDGALASRGADLGRAFVGSLTLGSGQFCTNPGLVIAVDGPGLDTFIGSARDAIAQSAATPMLTPGIADAFANGVTKLSGEAELIVRGAPSDSDTTCRAALFATDVDSFLKSDTLQAEVFGSSSLIVRCADAAEMRTAAENIEGQLTATVHADESDLDDARALLPLLELKAGRILFDGWPTGVEVCHAMVHGGPSPATSDSRTTSVGVRAIERYLRPVCYQDVPKSLLPSAIADGNPDNLWRRIDGRLQQD